MIRNTPKIMLHNGRVDCGGFLPCSHLIHFNDVALSAQVICYDCKGENDPSERDYGVKKEENLHSLFTHIPFIAF
jgi:hypothetical protein